MRPARRGGCARERSGRKCGTFSKAVAGAKLIDWLKIDSWIDSGLYSSWTGFRDWWSAYSSFFGKFEVKGFVRALNELACEALTLSVGGLLVVTTFALPAFEIAQGKINLADEYSVTFLDRYGNEIGKRGLLRDDSVPLEEIPDYMIKATLATEDRRFFEHFGVDVMGTFRALAANARHDTVVQGGSSLTQQLAKNMFLSPERSLTRKIKEAFIAVYLENHYTKPEILKLYFDRAYLGGGSYGVEAAAQYYFGKSIREVNLAEAAMLAGMFKAPTRYAPHVNLAASRARANEVLSNMVEAGYMSEGQVYGARMNPAKIVERSDYQHSRLLPRLGFRGGAAADARPGRSTSSSPAPPSIPACRRWPRIALETTIAQFGPRALISSRVRWWSWRPTARCALWSAARTTARASSTAPPMPTASPAPRSSLTSISPRSRRENTRRTPS